MQKERYIKEIKKWIQNGNSFQDPNAEQKLQGHLLDYAYDLERAELISFIQISFNYQVPKTILSENISLIQSLQPSLTNFGTIGENCLYIWVQALKPHLSSSLHAPLTPQSEQIEIVDELDDFDEEFEIYEDLGDLPYQVFDLDSHSASFVLTTEDSYKGPSDVAIDPEEEYTDCTICGVPVKRKNLSKHIQRIHPPEATSPTNSSSAASNDEANILTGSDLSHHVPKIAKFKDLEIPSLTEHVQEEALRPQDVPSPIDSSQPEEEGSNCCGCIVTLFILWAMILANS